jgi:hypothetical protein
MLPKAAGPLVGPDQRLCGARAGGHFGSPYSAASGEHAGSATKGRAVLSLIVRFPSSNEDETTLLPPWEETQQLLQLDIRHQATPRSSKMESAHLPSQSCRLEKSQQCCRWQTWRTR